jgi:hypothetical protein
VNQWLATFVGGDVRIWTVENHLAGGGIESCGFMQGGGGVDTFAQEEEILCFDFAAALGSRWPAAYPKADHYHLEYTPKIELENRRGPCGGGCG